MVLRCAGIGHGIRQNNAVGSDDGDTGTDGPSQSNRLCLDIARDRQSLLHGAGIRDQGIRELPDEVALQDPVDNHTEDEEHAQHRHGVPKKQPSGEGPGPGAWRLCHGIASLRGRGVTGSPSAKLSENEGGDAEGRYHPGSYRRGARLNGAYLEDREEGGVKRASSRPSCSGSRRASPSSLPSPAPATSSLCHGCSTGRSSPTRPSTRPSTSPCIWARSWAPWPISGATSCGT